MFLHIDGDIIKYRAGFAAEKTFYYLSTTREDGVMRFQYKKELVAYCKAHGLEAKDVHYEKAREAEPVENAVYNSRSIISKICENMQCDDLRVYLSGPTNFRDKLATAAEYKGNRPDEAKPVHGPSIVEFLQKKYDCDMSDGEEADDTMGIAQYAMWLRDPYESVIVTLDKDLDMIPGLHYNFVKDKSYYIDEVTAMRKFYMQVITGDTVDNIIGCYRIGPAGAAKLIDIPKGEVPLPELEKRWWRTCVEVYEDIMGKYPEKYPPISPEELALENARLLWIRREVNEIWEPRK